MEAQQEEFITGEVRTYSWVRNLALALLAVLVALYSRLPFFWGTHFPLNDGGMFAQILDDLRASHFLLPRETTYNFEHIPLTYPPLAFYVGDLVAIACRQTSLDVLRWLPLLWSLGCVFTLYYVALEFFEENAFAFCAAVIYAVLPRSAIWLTMGGGLTRSLGEFLMLLAVLFFLQAKKRDSRTRAVWAGVAAGLAMLSHLEAGLLAAGSLTVLAFFLPRIRQNLFLLLTAGLVSVAVVAPWLLWCLQRFGLSPFVAAFGARAGTLAGPVPLSEKTMIALLCLAVLFVVLKQPPFPIWALVTALLVPRSVFTHLVIMVALLAAWALQTAADWLGRRAAMARSTFALAAAVGTVILCLGFSTYYVHTRRFPNNRLHDLMANERAALSPAEVAAMQWVKTHTPAEAKFFVFSPRVDGWYNDFDGEWFPYLAQRQSVYTAQGKEWLSHDAFNRQLARATQSARIFTARDLRRSIDPAEFNYIFLTGPYNADHLRCARLIRQLPGFVKIYDTSGVEIWKRCAP